MAVHLLNILPTTPLSFQTPFELLFGHAPSYSHLRVFGCLCYPNISASSAHKLAPRSTRCIFFGYPHDHRGYRCLDLSTERIIISRHVIFDEAQFSYSQTERHLPHFNHHSFQPINVTSAAFPPNDSPAHGASNDTTARPSLPTTPGPSPSFPHDAPAPTRTTHPHPISPVPPSARSTPPPQKPRPTSPSPAHLPMPSSLANSVHLESPSNPSGPLADPHSPSPACSPIPFNPIPNHPNPTQSDAPNHAPSSDPSPTNHDPMTTRSKSGVFKPRTLFNLSASSISPLPASYRQALTDPHWTAAM